ncbi:MAG: HAMP domain-containing protein, partial [Ilumatobacteraceae bacterium]
MATSTERRTIRQRVIDLPVGRKLQAGFAALTGILVLVIGCLFLTVARLGAANDHLVGVADLQTQSADQLRFAAAELRSAQQAYVVGWPTTRTQFEQSAVQFEAALQALRHHQSTPQAAALIDKIATGYQTFLSTDQLIGEALQRDEPVLARNLTLGAESLAFGFMAEDASKLGDLAQTEQADAVARFDATSSDARYLGIILGIAALAVMAIATSIITRLIRNPLLRVQQAAERAAEGDLEAEADVTGDDETGRLARAFNTMLSKLRLREEALRAEHRRQETTAKIHRALEMSDDEPTALQVIGLTMADALPGYSAELLLADNSKSNLEQAVVAGDNPDGPGCPVGSPFSCVAVRSGSAVTFASSTAVDACPHLRNRGVTPCSAVCVPVTFMGRAMGVIHAVGTEHELPTDLDIDALTSLSTQAGARIGMLRTMTR